VKTNHKKWIRIQSRPGPKHFVIGRRPFCERPICVQAVAETLLVTEGAGLPIAIVRPSIVAAAWKEPLPGQNIQPNLSLKGQCHEVDVFRRSKHFLIGTFCGCADGYQDFSKAFHYPLVVISKGAS
jgi:hypothetical protein